MKNWRSVGCGALLAALVAFPAGMMVGGGGGREQAGTGEARRAAPKRPARNVYSPSVLDDPYVIEQQLRVVEALELGCRQFGERCQEARQAREQVEAARGR